MLKEMTVMRVLMFAGIALALGNLVAKDVPAPRTTSAVSDRDLDKIAIGQDVRKMETIVVTAKRDQPQVVKMGHVEPYRRVVIESLFTIEGRTP